MYGFTLTFLFDIFQISWIFSAGWIIMTLMKDYSIWKRICIDGRHLYEKEFLCVDSVDSISFITIHSGSCVAVQKRVIFATGMTGIGQLQSSGSRKG